METTRKGTLSDAIEAVSTIDIIEAFDIPHTTRRGRTYILCPGHDDQHFGSCYIDKNDNGYYCYACGEHVTKWNMVLKLNGNRKVDACEWFFKMAGLTPTEETRIDPYRKVLQTIRKLEKYIRNDIVYHDTCACDKIDSSYGRNINGEYLYSELTITNPLMEIYKSDKQTFKRIATQQLNLESNKAFRMKKFYESHDNDCLYVENVGLVSYKDMAAACNSVMEEIRALLAEVDML